MSPGLYLLLLRKRACRYILHIAHPRAKDAAVTSERYEMESVVRGHHIYKAVWTPVIREELLPSTSCSFWLHHSRVLLASTVKCLAVSLLCVLDCLSFKVTSYALRFTLCLPVQKNNSRSIQYQLHVMSGRQWDPAIIRTPACIS